jgi:hypothetical protein
MNLAQITNPAIDPKVGILKSYLDSGKPASYALGMYITNFIKLAFTIAGVAFFFMLIWGGFEYITAGGDKEKVGTAMKRISNALIGMVILLSSYAIFRLVNRVFGINVLNLVIPVIQ